MLSRSPTLEVVGTARDSDEALELVEQLRPDVVTCDLIMPGTDGVGFIQRQMSRRRLPIVIVSMAGESSERVLSGLDAGAIDFVQKPTALATEKVFDVADELIAKVTAAAGASMRERPKPSRSVQRLPPRHFRTGIVCLSSVSPPVDRRA
jgi:two-component system chemotaxis response regulator CheB